MELVFAILWSISLITGITALVVVLSDKPEVVISEDSTRDLTEEELKARPVVSSIRILEEPVAKEEAVKTDTEAAELEEKTYHPYDFIPMEDDMQIHCQKLCDEYHVGFAFFLAMTESESAFVIDCVGDSGNSLGYCQINRPNWDRYGLNASVPADNVEIGIRMMSELIIKYQEVDKVVMGYKGGEYAMLEWVKEGTRLKACDEIANGTIWWQERLDEWDEK